MALEDDLRQTLRDDPARVVLVVGTDVPLEALRGAPCEQLATWGGLLRSGLRRIHELQKITAADLAELEPLLDHTSLHSWLRIAERIGRELGAPGHGEFRRWLRETVGSFEQHITDGSVLDALAAHQRRGALLATTNYDLLLEHVTGLPTVTWRDPGSVERALRGDEPQVLHLHGAWRWPESVVLGIKSYAEVARDAHAQAVLTTLRTDRTFVFVGCGAGLHDPNLGAFLKWTATLFASSEYRHYRLCQKSDEDGLKQEHPAEQRIFPLSYGADHAALAPFLRSLLPPDAEMRPPQRARPAPTTVPETTTPAGPTPSPARPASITAQPAPLAVPEHWYLALDHFFADAFENTEIYQFLVQNLPGELAKALPNTNTSRSDFAFKAVEILKARGACDHAFFAALRNIRSHRRAEIDAIQLACLGTLDPPRPPPRPPPDGDDPTRVTFPQFALVLDRSFQWREFTDALREHPTHFLAVIHGDDRQDIKLFVERTLRWANGSFRGHPPRTHELVKVQCYQGGACPRRQEGWLAQIVQAIADKRIDRGELPAMLRTLAERGASLIVFIGANNGGLRHGPPAGMTLGEHASFVAALTSLIKALPVDAPHPIRILVPVEHAADASADDPLIRDVRAVTTHHSDLAYLPLEELDFPTWKEVLPSLRDECTRRRHACSDTDLQRTFQPTYLAHEARKGTQTHSFAALGQALSKLLDDHLPESAE